SSGSDGHRHVLFLIGRNVARARYVSIHVGKSKVSDVAYKFDSDFVFFQFIHVLIINILFIDLSFRGDDLEIDFVVTIQPQEMDFICTGKAVCAEKGFRLKVEAIADEQNNSKKKKEDGDVGLWKYPPHPNYFGELILLWYALINTHSLLSLGFDKLVNVMAFYGLKHAEVMSLDPREVVVPVVGGHAGVTILPLLSQAKAGAGSATLSMAYAAVKFADACLKGLRGDANIVECAFVASHVTELPFFASKVRLGRCGVDEVYGLGPLNEYGGWDWRRQRKSLKGVLRKVLPL
ncbi:unnamed protein product, partial [Brassica oleracea]